MARLISGRDMSGIRLSTLEVSDGELLTFIQALRHMRETLEPEAVEALTGAYRDEVEGMLEDLLSMVDLTEWEEAMPPLLAPAD